ncbi:MAG TPA: SagB family peptide dehydrogenase [Candidatus Eremiobacteraceae bacterium]|nr:SagB family peptide dehydrogenase [Candidatus Eremiobacteraceae bacterium]
MWRDSHRKVYRRSPLVVSYWLGPALVFENYATQKQSAGPVFVSEVLDFCGSGRTFGELVKRFPEQGERSLRAAIRQLLKYSLLEVSGKETKAADQAWSNWRSWNPAAGYFHFSTKNPKFEISEMGDPRRLQRIAREHPLPPRVKKYPGAAAVALPKGEAKAEFARVLEQRRTWREFSSKPMERETLGPLLWWSSGVQGWARIPKVGDLVLKTAPSGGAMHPLEAYALVRNVEGLSAGIYHYDAVGHRLELLRKGIGKGEIAAMLAGQRWCGNAAVVMLLTAVFERTQWKYEHPRAYRVVLAEAGHVCQTFCLTATWLGLAPFCTMALADTKIERALGIDGVKESVLYAAGVGMKAERKATAERLRI